MAKIEHDIFKEYIHSLPTRVCRKNEIIIAANQIHKDFYYVEKGIIRVFYYDKKGNDITHWFSAEGEIMAILSSVYDKSISTYGIQALENDTILRVASFEQFVHLKKTSPHFQNLYEETIVRASIEIAKRLVSIQTQSAKERYEDLLKIYPEIFQRVNLGHIASYLGITQQSLSRIRAEK